MNNLNGILLMIAAMAGFALEDLFVKLLSTSVSKGQILITLGIGSASFFAILARSKGHNIFARHVWTPLLMVRALCEALGAITFVTALSLVPISTVAAVFQVLPLTITMGAALFLGEDVGWRRWAAIIVGFIGVLIIIRPGLSGFDPSVLYVLASVVAIAARDLITRRVPSNVASTVVSFQAFASLIVAGTVMVLFSADTLVAVTKQEAGFFVAAIIFGVSGYYGIVACMRAGDAAAVMPFRYTRLLFSILIGVVVFGERPDAWTLLGSGIVIGTGMFTFIRERRLAAAHAKAVNVG
jgi:drug/metabolite transporter (DMT)-like permease